MRSRKHTGHFYWCPGNFNIHLCICQVAIYISMAIVGGTTAYYQHELGEKGGAATPQADAWHLVNDTVSDIVVVCIAGLVVLQPFIHKERTVRLIGAYMQVILLAAATFFIGSELYLKISASTHFIPIEMVKAGIVGVAGNGFRLWILHVKKGGWDLNRFIQDKHVRLDLYWSIGAFGIGVISWIIERLSFDTAASYIDTIATFIMLVIASHMTYSAYKKTRHGEIDTHHHN